MATRYDKRFREFLERPSFPPLSPKTRRQMMPVLLFLGCLGWASALYHLAGFGWAYACASLIFCR